MRSGRPGGRAAAAALLLLACTLLHAAGAAASGGAALQRRRLAQVSNWGGDGSSAAGGGADGGDGTFAGMALAPSQMGAPPDAATYVKPAQLPLACRQSAITGLDKRAANPGYDMAAAASRPRRRHTIRPDPLNPGNKAQVGDWGPHPIRFPAVTYADVPPGCNAVSWAQYRFFQALERMVGLGFCYCHHHVPWWMPPPGDYATCNPGCPGTRAMPYQGADCSSFSSYLYNMAFGNVFTAAIGSQACKPGAAPGKLLPYTLDQQDMFQPGDLLFITYSGKSGGPPIRVSHVIMWTGLKVDFNTTGGPLSWDTILGNQDPRVHSGAANYAQARRAAGQPVYIIADSHYTGLNFRPFAGWYVNSFSHARRVLYTSDLAALPTNDPSVASFDGKHCISNWALQGARGLGGAAGAGGAAQAPAAASAGTGRAAGR